MGCISVYFPQFWNYWNEKDNIMQFWMRVSHYIHGVNTKIWIQWIHHFDICSNENNLFDVPFTQQDKSLKLLIWPFFIKESVKFIGHYWNQYSKMPRLLWKSFTYGNFWCHLTFKMILLPGCHSLSCLIALGSFPICSIVCECHCGCFTGGLVVKISGKPS